MGGFFSLAPEAFVSGGMISAGDYKISTSVYAMNDYNGKVAIAQPALRWELVSFDPKTNAVGEEIHTQYWSAGSADKVGISPDGRFLQPKSADSKGLSNSSNLFVLIQELVNCNFPITQLQTGDSSVFTGMCVRIELVPAPKRSNLPKSNVLQVENQPEQDKVIPVVRHIYALPGQAPTPVAAAPAKKNSTRAAAAAAPAAAPATTGAITFEDAVVAMLGEAGNPATMAKQQARVNLFKYLTGKVPNAERDAMAKSFDANIEMAAMLAGYSLNGDQLVKS